MNAMHTRTAPRTAYRIALVLTLFAAGLAATRSTSMRNSRTGSGKTKRASQLP